MLPCNDNTIYHWHWLLPHDSAGITNDIDNDINMRLYGVNSRTRNLISAPDDASKQSAETYLKKIEEGELGVIGTNALFDGVKVHSGSGGSNGSIKDTTSFDTLLVVFINVSINILLHFTNILCVKLPGPTSMNPRDACLYKMCSISKQRPLNCSE